MGLMDKIENETKEFIGKAKEFIGDKTNNHDLETEGREEKQEANLAQAGEKVKDTAEDVTNDVKDTAKDTVDNVKDAFGK